MTIEKRVDMAENMQKIATEDLVEDDGVICVDGDGWSITLSKKVHDTAGEDAVRAVMELAMAALKKDTEN